MPIRETIRHFVFDKITPKVQQMTQMNHTQMENSYMAKQ